MKPFLLFITLPMAGLSFAQVVFEPHFIDPCSGKDTTHAVECYIWNDSIGEFEPCEIPIQKPDSIARHHVHGYAPDPFYLSHSGFPDSILSDYQGIRIAFMPPGNYELSINYELPFHLDLQSQGIIRDTFYCYPYEQQCGTLYFGGCERIADGKLVTHYYNGKPRLSAVFENGKLTDTLRMYYPSGGLYTLIVPRKKDVYTLTYYESGVVQSDVRPRKAIMYYENGIVESDDDDKKGYDRSYNETGQLIRESKPHRHQTIHYAYHANGGLKSTIYWDRSRYRKRVYDNSGVLKETICRAKRRRWGNGSKDKQFEWIVFNAKGKPEQSILVETEDYSFTLEDHYKLVRSADILEATVYESGKKATRYIASGENSLNYNTFTRKGLRWKMTGNIDSRALRQIIVLQ